MYLRYKTVYSLIDKFLLIVILKMNRDHAERCKQLVAAVENISQNEMEEIFKMIHNHGCAYTRNNNGLFINLAWIPEELLKELEQYVKFCNRSQTELKKYESICDVLNTKLREDSAYSKEQKIIDKDNILLQVNINKDTERIIINDKINKITNTLSNTTLTNNISEIDINNGIDIDEIDDIKPSSTLDPESEILTENLELIDEVIEKSGSKISSSMKYSLLKKRYAKVNILNTNNIENDLKQEPFIL
jgi:hypothetical protein